MRTAERAAVGTISVGSFLWSLVCLRLHLNARRDFNELEKAVTVTVRPIQLLSTRYITETNADSSDLLKRAPTCLNCPKYFKKPHVNAY